MSTNTSSDKPVRRARISRSSSGYPTAEQVEAYLPLAGNYAIEQHDVTQIVIAGHDNAGWTLDGYIIPRLGSGMIFAAEMDERAVIAVKRSLAYTKPCPNCGGGEDDGHQDWCGIAPGN